MNSVTKSSSIATSTRAPRPSDSLSQNIVERARRAHKLSREEERELIERWQQHGDRKAANRLAECSMRFVVAVAFKHRRYNVPLEVLISEGNLGLVRAMDKFDLGQDTRFSTYATYWIRYYIIDHIMRSWSMVGGGSGALKTRMFFRLRRERARAWSLHGEGDVAARAISERMNIPVKKLGKLMHQLDNRDLSLNTPTHEDSSATLMDTLFVEADQGTGLAHTESMANIKPVLQKALERLNERERIIVERRLMADADDEQSLSKLGETFGVSRERVRQIEEALKSKLRAFISERCSPDDLVAA